MMRIIIVTTIAIILSIIVIAQLSLQPLARSRPLLTAC